jgi:uncharacterized repeat protein (TIGR03809 family)
MTKCASNIRLCEIALKWRKLAEKRRDDLVELHMSGRWSTYFDEKEFKRYMREAAVAVERWTKVAPLPTAAPETQADAQLPIRDRRNAA